MLLEVLLSIASAAADILLLLVGNDVSDERLAARRRRAGLCESCAHDTRGSPGLRCPECNGLIRIVGRERF